MTKKIEVKCGVCNGKGWIKGHSTHGPRHMNKLGEELIKCPNHTPTKIYIVTEETL
jgi:hypothetical protein